MKIVSVDRRKLGVIIIVVGLMVILFGVEKNFDTKLKHTALMQNDIKSLTQYSGLNDKLRYKLPSNWNCKVQDMSGDEIIYHSDFKSTDGKIHGFVQVWNLQGNLKLFLQNSKIVSEKQNLYESYNIGDVDVNGKDGYLVEYTITKEIGDSYRGIEYFLEKRKQFCRFSFFIKDTDFKENMPTIFETIVKTLEYK